MLSSLARAYPVLALCGVHAAKLARATRRVTPSIVEAVPVRRLSHLFDFVAERTGVAFEADRVLAITGVERSGPGCRAAAHLGYSGCERIYFRISPGSLYSCVSHLSLSGVNKRR